MTSRKSKKRFSILHRFSAGTISRKYSCGYIMILLVMFLLFAVSFVCNQYSNRQYEREMDSLLSLNRLFAGVETTNTHLFDIYTYLRASSFDDYLKSSAETKACADSLEQGLRGNWSREVADLCNMVQTYLDKSGELTQQLQKNHSASGFGSDSEINRLYSETQDIISYINVSFKDIYSVKLVSAQAKRLQMQRLNIVFTFFQLILLGSAFCVFLVFYRKVVTGITRSVAKLTDFAVQVTENPTKQTHIGIQTNDELELFAAAFNKMLDTIQNQISQIEKGARIREQLQEIEMKNIRMTSALQSSQLSLLQARINPHFLFNTLNMISQTAYMENAEETSHLIECTANYLRYNLGKSTQPVTVGDELANLQEYVYIQQCRFGDRIRFHFDINPTCEQQQLPCMILQPLVENAITHGLGSLIDGGRVTVRAFHRDRWNCLEVEDNGVGIPAEALKELRSSVYESDGELSDQHIGLQNVYLRLKLFFGGDVDFLIDSTTHRTLIRIGIPWDR